jgi:uncharacterized membrane protein YdbT with pleckstrin-like domain
MARQGLGSTTTLGVRTSAVAARPPSGQRSLTVAIADSLIAGETIVFASRKHWMAPIRASLTAGLMVIGAAFIRWLSPSGEGLFGTIGGILDLIALGLFLAGIGWIIYNIVAWRTAEFAVTNMRVLREEGLASHRSSTTLLSSLSDVKTSVGVLGRQLGYGDITLLTTSGGSGEDRFLAITRPLDFRGAVMEQKLHGGPAALEPTAAPAGASQAAVPAAASVTTAAAPAQVRTANDDADTLRSLAELRDSGAISAEDYEAKKTEILARM